MTEQFGRENLKTIRKDIMVALADVELKHGITIDLGGIRFQDNEFRCKLTGATKAQAGGASKGENASERKWAKGLSSFSAYTVGFFPEDAGKVFTLRGQQYILIGFRAKAKQRIVARKPGRKSYIALNEKDVLPLIEKARSAA